MSHAFRRTRAKRVLEVPEDPDELDFDSVLDTAEPEPSSGVLHKGVAALAVTTLGLVTAAGVAVAASPDSSRIDTATVSTDKNSLDVTRGTPAPDQFTIEQQVQSQVARARNVQGQTKGSLAAFAGGATVTRSAARTELSAAIAQQGASSRTSSLDQQSTAVAQTATDTGAALRDDQIAADLAKVKAESARIIAQQQADAAKLKAQAAKAAAAKAAGKSVQASAASKTSSTSTTSTPATGTTIDTSGLSAKGAVTPIASGHYSVGAYWGEYGSWSKWHTGQDFPSPVGTPVRAVVDGIVSHQCGGCQGWAGDSVAILHMADGSSVLYAHLNDSLPEGTQVKAGQVIGHVGLKGRTFGPHLHFEYYPKGVAAGNVYSTQNPITFLLGLGLKP